MSRSSELTYTPAWWVPGPHLQTLWGKLVRRPAEVSTRTELWPTPDDDELEIRRLDAPAGAPRLLLLHGLEGSIDSHYLRGSLSLARARGWAADVLIFRGCNGRINRARRMYHSGETSDLDLVVRRLVAEHAHAPLAIAGFSLGGNVLLKWLGERGDTVPEPVVAAAAVSVPFDLARGSRHIERGFSRVYSGSFLRSLRRKALAKLHRYPDLFDPDALVRARTIFDFDDAVTAPMHGFSSAGDYYAQSSSIGFLEAIRVPTLLLSSRDDPFLPPDVLDDVARIAQRNPHLTTEFVAKGGHVGFVSGRWPLATRYFGEERMLEFLGWFMQRTRPLPRSSVECG